MGVVVQLNSSSCPINGYRFPFCRSRQAWKLFHGSEGIVSRPSPFSSSHRISNGMMSIHNFGYFERLFPFTAENIWLHESSHWKVRKRFSWCHCYERRVLDFICWTAITICRLWGCRVVGGGVIAVLWVVQWQQQIWPRRCLKRYISDVFLRSGGLSSGKPHPSTSIERSPGRDLDHV